MKIEIVEVGPRDGLQSESTMVSMPKKYEMVRRLTETGLTRIEVGAFVSPKWVPQMSDSKELCLKVMRDQEKGLLKKNVKFSALVPNEKGMIEALSTSIKEIAVFTAASESFVQKNINCTIKESLHRFLPVFALAKRHKVKVRGYVSTAFYCPYEGKIHPKAVVPLVEKILEMGAFEVSVGDTLGFAVPLEVNRLLTKLLRNLPVSKLAMHFHDTRGTALSNISESLRFGVRKYDTSLGGLGGCPYAPGAAGNVATEDVVYFLEKMGHRTGVNLEKLVSLSRWMAGTVGRSLPGRLAKSLGKS